MEPHTALTVAQQVCIATGLPKDGVAWKLNRSLRRRFMHNLRRLDPRATRGAERRENEAWARGRASGVDPKYLHAAERARRGYYFDDAAGAYRRRADLKVAA